MKKKLLVALLLALLCTNMTACSKSKECAFAGCQEKAVKGSEYCAVQQDVMDSGVDLIPAN
jgi:hypothetical protein